MGIILANEDGERSLRVWELGQGEISDLHKGMLTGESVEVTIPANWQVGRSEIGIYADVKQELIESNEQDNKLIREVIVSRRDSPPIRDLLLHRDRSRPKLSLSASSEAASADD